MTLASNGLANAIPFRFTYADATARGAASGFTSADVNSLALQLDNGTVWLLAATTPTWTQVGGSTGLTDPTTTKGDLLVRSSSAVARLAVGANNTVPVADSAQTLGVKWAAGVPGSWFLIEEWRPSDGTQSHDFTIPGTVAEVEWEISGRTKEAVQQSNVVAVFNADTGNNYDNVSVYTQSGATPGNGVNGATSAAALGSLPGTSATAGRQGRVTGSVSRVQETIEHNWLSWYVIHNSATPAIGQEIKGGHHTGTSAITTLTIKTTSANGFAVGAVVRVFGRLT
jgi:hypothetical protein